MNLHTRIFERCAVSTIPDIFKCGWDEDTAAFGYEPKVLEIALSFFGPERVLFGTDTPFDRSGGQYFTAETLRSIQDMAISGEVQTALLSGNAIKALKLG